MLITFLIKLWTSGQTSGFQFCNFIKKKLQHKCFPLNFSKFSRILICRISRNSYFWYYKRVTFSKNASFHLVTGTKNVFSKTQGQKYNCNIGSCKVQASVTNQGYPLLINPLRRYYQVMFTFYGLREVNRVTLSDKNERATVAKASLYKK